MDYNTEQTLYVSDNQPKAKFGIGKIIALFVLTVIISVLMGASGVLLFFHYNPGYTSNTVTNINKTEKEVTVTDTGIADAVEKIYDSVVVVKTYKNNKLYSTGTGFVYKKSDNNYYLLTNYHVIQDGNKISVLFTDGTEIDVKVSGGDKYSDIAVLSYETDQDLSVAEIGESVSMRVGDTVFAIGAPLDSAIYSWSVTRGILSGKDREIEVSTSNGYTSDWIMQVLQTDAAINSGNSGGPLCNSNGQVVGITNMKLITSGVEGMGFAIPIEEAIAFADKIISGEDVIRPFIGVGMVSAADNGYANKYGVEPRDGVLITDVYDNSPAQKAGLKIGDIIIKMNDVEISNIASLRYELYKYSVNDTVNVNYIRNGKTGVTKLTLGANEE